jgi:hypothetical protein
MAVKPVYTSTVHSTDSLTYRVDVVHKLTPHDGSIVGTNIVANVFNLRVSCTLGYVTNMFLLHGTANSGLIFIFNFLENCLRLVAETICAISFFHFLKSKE